MTRAVRRGLWLGLAVLWLAGPAAALTVGVFSSSAGLDQGYGYTGCPSCSTVYSLSGPAAVSGLSTITFANGLTMATETVGISLVNVSPLFSDGSDTVSFSGLSYTGTVSATVTPFAGMYLVQQSGAASGTVSGSYSASLGGSGPVNVTPDLHSLTCLVDASGTGTCGFTFGPTSFPVNDGAQTLDFQHTFNLNIPEPETWLLMTVGLMGLGLLGRRRKSS